MEKLIVKIIGASVIFFIFLFISDEIFNWAGPEGPAYCFGYMLGHFAKSIVNLF